MTHGSLFSGIGGFDLAAEWIGWKNVFHCEWNPFGQKVLKHYWPNSISYNDITKTDFTIHRGAIDIITGGFPCQPYSSAGKRLGKADDRHLWPQMLRAIREIKPRWIVGENVYGLVNWNGGMVFEEVQTDLENEGYEVQPYLLPAASVGAPHRRDRIWFVAYSKGSRTRQDIGGLRSKLERCDKWEKNDSFVAHAIRSDGFERIAANTESKPSERMQSEQREFSEQEQRKFRGISGEMGYKNAADTDSWGTQARKDRCILEEQNKEGKARGFINDNIQRYWSNFPTVSPICNGDDGLSNRLDGITFSKWRNESIKAGGNAIVPQVVYQIFKAIEQYENILS